MGSDDIDLSLPDTPLTAEPEDCFAGLISVIRAICVPSST